MSLGFLYFLADPWFVVPWYAVGALGAWYVIYDLRNKNTVLKPAMKWAWPIIVFFFSVIGLALYWGTARAPGIGGKESQEEKKKLHHAYEQSMWRRVNGAVIHCVAGDGFGIMTAMVIARFASVSFWQEFWFEYLVGFVIGWIIFQRKSMTMMTDNLPMQLAMSFRAEFFSMLTVMGGMGAVMTYITPLVVTAQPKPFTAAFWGFGMLGLLVGFVLTFPMNWMMVKVGWKHGMGGMEGGEQHQIKNKPLKMATLAAMVVLGIAGLLLPAWLTEVRASASLRGPAAALEPAPAETGQALYDGLRSSLERAVEGLRTGKLTTAALAIDAAHRAADVGAHSAPGAFYSGFEEIRNARLALQQGDQASTVKHLENALQVIGPAARAIPPILHVDDYKGAILVSQKGAIIGKVTDVSGGALELALGGWQNAWGVIDFSSGKRVIVPAEAVAFGPPRIIGYALVLLPVQE